MRLTSLAIALALCSTLSAQQLIDRFDYPDGNVPPTWNVHSGSFAIKNKELVCMGGRVWQYLTRRGPTQVANCVLDIEVIYPATASLYFGGVTARHDGSAGNGLVMLKLQDNASAGTGAFNTAWLYERPTGGSKLVTLNPPTKNAVGRMIVKGTEAWALIDGDMDGFFEFQSAIKPLGTNTKPDGLVGANGYNTVQMDNWKFYDAIVHESPVGAKATINSTYTMKAWAPLRQVGSVVLPTPWVGFLSIGNDGIPLPDGRAIPVKLAGFWALWSGVLTQAAPEGTMAIPIPNDSALVGVTVFTSAITVGEPGKFLGIGAISNDHGFKIQ